MIILILFVSGSITILYPAKINEELNFNLLNLKYINATWERKKAALKLKIWSFLCNKKIYTVYLFLHFYFYLNNVVIFIFENWKKTVINHNTITYISCMWWIFFYCNCKSIILVYGERYPLPKKNKINKIFLRKLPNRFQFIIKLQ